MARSKPVQTVEGLRRYRLLLREKGSHQSLAARVRVLSAHGTYIAPVGHQAEPVAADAGFTALGRPGDIMWHGRQAWAYLDDCGFVDVPGWRITVRAEKGPEYVPVDQIIDLTAVDDDTLVIELERWTDRQAHGWFSGDTHVHEPDPAALIIESRAEDIHATSVLVANGTGSWLAFPYFRTGLHPVSDAAHLLQYGQEYRHNLLGHVTFLGINELLLPEPRLALPRSAAGDWPTLVSLCRTVRNRGGVILWAHWPWPSAECPVAVALGLIDAFEIVGIRDPRQLMPQLDDSYALLEASLRRRFGRSIYDLSPLDLYYVYLSCGFQIPLSAGSDKYMAWRIVGGARVYAHVSGELTYDAWIQSVKAGRTFVTTAPLLDLAVDGNPIGACLERNGSCRVHVAAQAESIQPYERLELLINGEVVCAVEPAGMHFRARIDAEFEIRGSCWIAARCIGAKTIRYGPQGEMELPIFAHTSPIYVQVPGHPMQPDGKAELLLEQVLYLQEWIRERATYDDDEQRTAALQQAQEAEAIWRRILGKAQGEETN